MASLDRKTDTNSRRRRVTRRAVLLQAGVEQQVDSWQAACADSTVSIRRPGASSQSLESSACRLNGSACCCCCFQSFLVVNKAARFRDDADTHSPQVVLQLLQHALDGAPDDGSTNRTLHCANNSTHHTKTQAKCCMSGRGVGPRSSSRCGACTSCGQTLCRLRLGPGRARHVTTTTRVHNTQPPCLQQTSSCRSHNYLTPPGTAA